jgi:hypothetical protein
VVVLLVFPITQAQAVDAVSITASVANTSQGGIKIQHDIISSIILCGDTYTSNPVTAQLPMSTGSVYAEFIATPGYTLESITDNGIPRTDFWFEGWNLTPRFTIADTPIDPTQRWNAFIKNNHTIVAKFRTLYQINASVTSTTGGSITIGYNRYSINYGTHTDAVFGLPITVYVTPPSGYVVDKLLDNGVEVTGYSYPPNSNSYDPYTFQTRSDHNLQVSFRKPTIISTVVGSGGTITPSGTTSPDSGSNTTFVMAPEYGYYLASLSDNGNTVNVSPQQNSPGIYTYTLTAGSDHIINAYFSLGTGTPVAVPGLTPPVIFLLVAGLSGILYWQSRKRRVS